MMSFSITTKVTLLFICSFFIVVSVHGQQKVLTIKEAIQAALSNYGTIKSKQNYVNASKASVKQTQLEYLPNLSISAQQDYGTINGQSGPLYGYRGMNAASSGPALSSQNWNAAFGGLYLANVNWDFFNFGQAKKKVLVSRSILARDESDLSQEQFQQQVQVSGAYLNLLAAQKLVQSQQNNLDRALALRQVIITRVQNGLNAGVDSSLANAEVSNAKITLTRALDYQQEQENQLAVLMGVASESFSLDSFFVSRIPNAVTTVATIQQSDHPLLQYYQNRVDLSKEQTRYLKTLSYPTISMFSVIQGRASGFKSNYGANDLTAFTQSYSAGVNPTRGNYLVGLGLIWNITSLARVHQQVLAQEYTSKALQDEYNLVDQRLKAQLILSDNKIKNALNNYREAPIQVESAKNAYLQKSVLYKNGLSTIVDITQALYTLNRAETDRDIAYNNVWQALLLKSAASGDFGLFINEF